jgi:TolA-binding protein
MSDPERLFSDAPSPLAKRMLSAARDEQPPDVLLERTLLALGAGGAALGATASASGAAAGTGASAGATGAKAGIVAAAKWLGLGALGGALLSTAAYEVRDAWRVPAPVAAPQAPSPAREARAAPAPEGPVLSPGVNERSVEPAQRAAGRALAPSAKVEPNRALELAAEVAALDAARQALANGDPRRALSLLDAYRDRFPEARLLPEALHVRMEALYQSGDRAGAARVAERLLAGFPQSPHAARARQIASEGHH